LFFQFEAFAARVLALVLSGLNADQLTIILNILTK